MPSLALRRLAEAAADRKVIAGAVADRAENSKSHRLPARRFRLEGSRAGNSALVTEKAGHELRRQWGGELVETIVARDAYAKHFACEVACPRKSCKAEKGKCCINSDGDPTIVHKARVVAWEMKDVVADPTAPNATKPVKAIDRDCPKCQAPAGTKCRNQWGSAREGYHAARRADARATTAANAAAAPVVDPSSIVDLAARSYAMDIETAPTPEVDRFVEVATAPPTPLDVVCPDTQCRAPRGGGCHSLGKKVATHKVRVYAADPTKSPLLKREPSLRVACPTCNSPKFARCVTGARKFTKPHATRDAAWAAGEEQGR